MEKTPLNLDKLQLSRFHVQCLLGMSRRERVESQSVGIDISMYFDARVAAESGALYETVDYVRTIGDVRFLMEHGEFLLIETAAEAIARLLLRPPGSDAPRAKVERVKLKLSKPEALPDVVPALELTRDSGYFVPSVTETKFARIEKIIAVPDCAVHLIYVKPRARVSFESEPTRESELVLGSHLRVQNRSVRAGTAFTWWQEAARHYENVSDLEQCLIHISHPAKLPWQFAVTTTRISAAPGEHYYPVVMDDYLV